MTSWANLVLLLEFEVKGDLLSLTGSMPKAVNCDTEHL